MLERVADSKKIVIDGLRFPEDHAFFFERFGSDFIHLHVQALAELRADRYREHEQDGVPFEVADSQPVEGKIGDLADLASAVLRNEGSLAEHRENVLNCLRALSQAQGRECPFSVVVGGQFGSEGKGKVAHRIAYRGKRFDRRARRRTNSGHTAVDDEGITWGLRQLPVSVLAPGTKAILRLERSSIPEYSLAKSKR